MEDKQFDMDKFTEYVQKIYHNKQIMKEYREETKMLTEDVEYMFNEAGAQEVLVRLTEDEYIAVTPSIRIKEELDKDGLAESLQIDKNEMKKPWDFAKLAEKIAKDEEMKEKGITMSTIISAHTKSEQIIKPKMNKRKDKKKKRDKKGTQ
jgi:hypothetical protein